MKLYYHPAEPGSQKVLIGLYEKDVGFEPKLIDLEDSAQKNAYERLYPLCRLPLLMLKTHYLSESSTVLEYLDATFDTGTRLMPDDAGLALRVRFVDRITERHISETSARLRRQSERAESLRDQLSIEADRRELDSALSVLELLVAHRTWAVDDRFTLADCALSPALERAQQHVDFERRPNLKAYLARLRERPSVARVLREARL